ncbi:MAG: hypothetical protein KA199_04095 [Sphingorhabdus sp.]|nr:hypothetical protein [Sphingorhabdus sp.]
MKRPLALVTGGVRRLGAIIAARLSDAGYDLALSSHGAGNPDPALAEAIARNGCDWQHFAADLYIRKSLSKDFYFWGSGFVHFFSP